MESIEVRTKNELESAKDAGYSEIKASCVFVKNSGNHITIASSRR